MFARNKTSTSPDIDPTQKICSRHRRMATLPTFDPTIVACMLDEMTETFDRDLSLKLRQKEDLKNKYQVHLRQ